MSRRADPHLDPDAEPGSTTRSVTKGSEPITAEVPIDRISGIEQRVIEAGAWTLEEGSGEHRALPTEGRRTLDPPAPERVPSMMLRLSREIGIDRQDDEIVHAFVEAMRDLFPERRFVLRLVGAEGDGVSLFYASGRLSHAGRDPLLLERGAASRHALGDSALARVGVTLSDRYVPFFEAGATGFDVPLADGERVLGILSVEYPAGISVPAWDAPILVPLALELGSKLRSARLLRESSYLRDYLAQVIEHANAPIVVLRRDRGIENVNLATLRVTGGAREGWMGRDFLDFLPPSEHGRATTALEAALRGRPSTDVELRLPRASGGFARVAFNTASITAPDGEIAGVVAIGRDLTEVRDLEEQIIQAEKLATLGQLAAGVVHELNNPLTSISVYAEYLLTKGRRGGAEAGDLEKLSRITEAAARMLRFTRDLVTYARPSSEEPASVSMVDEIDQALVFCEHVITEGNVEIQRDYAAELPTLWAVRGQLHQVFINLVTNACHAIAEHRGAAGGRIVVRVAAEEDETLRVEVEDDGPGIAHEHVEHVFEPFFSTKGEGKGTGLGLSIVRNIVQQHGGTIEVSSRHREERSGTTFRLRFPRRATSR
ncbi:two-component system sensor histidine kinase NtrB [Sandaracinus amylolyticus]|nr:ATP-binding protein [Sandaracinus amylolyticus]